jgi:uncharacterized membrane protein YjjP (DUF1212 family)
LKEAFMDNESGRRNDGEAGPKTPRWLRVLGAVGFSLAFIIHLLQGRWVTAAFFVAVGFLFLKGREIDRWPKAARYLLIAVYAALAVGTFVTLTLDIKSNW